MTKKQKSKRIARIKNQEAVAKCRKKIGRLSLELTLSNADASEVYNAVTQKLSMKDIMVVVENPDMFRGAPELIRLAKDQLALRKLRIEEKI